MKQKQHHEGRVEVPAFKSNKVVLDHGVARWIKGRIYQVKGSCTYLLREPHTICACLSLEEDTLLIFKF